MTLVARTLPLLIAAALALLGGCAPAEPPPDDDDDDDDDGAPLDDGGGGERPPEDGWRALLDEDADYDALVAGADVKLLFHAEGAELVTPVFEGCAFQDMNEHTYHLPFLRSFDEHAELSYDDYVAMVLVRATRVWWGGGVRRYDGVVAYTVYAETDAASRLTAADVIEVDAKAKECAPFFAGELAFLPSDSAQSAMVAQQGAALAAAGVVVVDAADLREP